MEFVKVRKNCVAEEIVAQIVQKIAEHEWQSGDRLPSEAELTRIFGASKYSVRKALEQLNVMGMLETRQGMGTFVREPSGEAILRPMLARKEELAGTLQNVLEFRAGIEPESVRLAAMRAGEEDLEAMRSALRKMEQATRKADQSDYSRGDIEFHVAAARASRNTWILQAMKIVESLYMKDLEHMTRRKQYSVHVRIFEAIEKRDAEEAFRLMRRHLLDSIDFLHNSEEE